MADFNSLKIATFSGVNASPIAPTATSPGNASHLIAKFNALVDSLGGEFSALENQIENKLSQGDVQDLVRINDTRPLQMGIYSQMIDLVVSEDKTVDNELLLNLSLSNSFRVRIDASYFSDAVNLRVSGSSRAGQIFTVVYWLDSLGSGGTLQPSSTDFYGNPPPPPDISIPGEFQAITYLHTGGGMGGGMAFALEIARGPVLTSTGGY